MEMLKKIPKPIIAIVVILLLELTIFNFRFYIMKLSGLENEVIELKRDNLTSYKYDDFTLDINFLASSLLSLMIAVQ